MAKMKWINDGAKFHNTTFNLKKLHYMLYIICIYVCMFLSFASLNNNIYIIFFTILLQQNYELFKKTSYIIHGMYLVMFWEVSLICID